jgi:hypothetical protein
MEALLCFRLGQFLCFSIRGWIVSATQLLEASAEDGNSAMLSLRQSSARSAFRCGSTAGIAILGGISTRYLFLIAF